MCQRAAHVLVHHVVLGVQQAVLLGQHVHGEAVGGHQLVLLGCTGPKGEDPFMLRVLRATCLLLTASEIKVFGAWIVQMNTFVFLD